MKPQKRFTKKFEIEAEIGKLKRRAKQKTVDAASFEATAATSVRDANIPGTNPGDKQFLIEQADHIRKKAIKLRRSVEIINDVKIPMLGRTLAAFQTNTLFPGDDQAVVLQK